MQIFQTKWFAHWAEKEGLTSKALCAAVTEISRGLVDANLGAHVVKKRVALGGRGKSGGARTLLAFKLNDKAFLCMVLPKTSKAISPIKS